MQVLCGTVDIERFLRYLSVWVHSSRISFYRNSSCSLSSHIYFQTLRQTYYQWPLLSWPFFPEHNDFPEFWGCAVVLFEGLPAVPIFVLRQKRISSVGQDFTSKIRCCCTSSTVVAVLKVHRTALSLTNLVLAVPCTVSTLYCQLGRTLDPGQSGWEEELGRKCQSRKSFCVKNSSKLLLRFLVLDV